MNIQEKRDSLWELLNKDGELVNFHATVRDPMITEEEFLDEMIGALEENGPVLTGKDLKEYLNNKSSGLD